MTLPTYIIVMQLNTWIILTTYMKVVYMDENNIVESTSKVSLAMWIKFNYMHNDHIHL